MLQRRGGAGARLAPLRDEDVATIVALLKPPTHAMPRLSADQWRGGDEAGVQPPFSAPPPHQGARGLAGQGDAPTCGAERQAREPHRKPQQVSAARPLHDGAGSFPRSPPHSPRCNGAPPPGQAPLRAAGASHAVGRAAPPAARLAGKAACPARPARDAGDRGAAAGAAYPRSGLPGEVGAAVDVAAWQAVVARLAARAEELRTREERLMRRGA
eukprot:scaffold7147_cov130-Isochrysis_galbana.AAC.1